VHATRSRLTRPPKASGGGSRSYNRTSRCRATGHGVRSVHALNRFSCSSTWDHPCPHGPDECAGGDTGAPSACTRPRAGAKEIKEREGRVGWRSYNCARMRSPKPTWGSAFPGKLALRAIMRHLATFITCTLPLPCDGILHSTFNILHLPLLACTRRRHAPQHAPQHAPPASSPASLCDASAGAESSAAPVSSRAASSSAEAPGSAVLE